MNLGHLYETLQSPQYLEQRFKLEHSFFHRLKKVFPFNPEESQGYTPDDLDDVILGKMIKGAGIFYKMELKRGKG